ARVRARSRVTAARPGCPGPGTRRTGPEPPSDLLEVHGTMEGEPAIGPIGYEEFARVDMRVGRVVAVHDFPEARTPAWRLEIDFGPEIGTRSSSAQITHYARDDLEGRLVIGVVNLEPRQIGPVRSEVLVLGALDAREGVVLLRPDGEVALGDRIA
ncbi:MAG TPA: tRNA-binding protein, partial [Thermoleophilaceae bacterium]|nr:tRNA-binding protein [Thermoleophilaceae bacterium]